jgi:hypothetical protein
MILATPADALTIIETYPDVVFDRQAALVEQWKLEREHAAPALGRVEYEGKPKIGALIASWSEKRLPCPFLTPAGKCAVYDARPYTCASRAAASPPELCHGDAGHEPMEGMAPAVSGAIMQRQVSIAHASGMPNQIFGGLASAVVGVANFLERKSTEPEKRD